uniref:Uncharacterized protein n=1 Tax=viral metagenome TaxID=1070528 RepID=A0A6C0LUK9_9ZZZZ
MPRFAEDFHGEKHGHGCPTSCEWKQIEEEKVCCDNCRHESHGSIETKFDRKQHLRCCQKTTPCEPESCCPEKCGCEDDKFDNDFERKDKNRVIEGRDGRDGSYAFEKKDGDRIFEGRGGAYTFERRDRNHTFIKKDGDHVFERNREFRKNGCCDNRRREREFPVRRGLPGAPTRRLTRSLGYQNIGPGYGGYGDWAGYDYDGWY